MQATPQASLQSPRPPDQSPEANTGEQQAEDFKAGAHEEAKQSSSSSEFVFDPDPDFLSKINANLRANDEKMAEQPPRPPAMGQPPDNEAYPQPPTWAEEEEDEDSVTGMELADLHDHGDGPEGGPGQQPSEPLYPGNPQNSAEEGKLNLEERNELISDCGSDIQVEEEKDPAMAEAARQFEDEREASSLTQEEANRAAIAGPGVQTEESKSFSGASPVVQGAQGDFQMRQGDPSSSQMSVFQSIQ